VLQDNALSGRASCSAKQGRRFTRVLLDRIAVRDLPPKGISGCYLALGNVSVNANLPALPLVLLVQYLPNQHA